MKNFFFKQLRLDSWLIDTFTICFGFIEVKIKKKKKKDANVHNVPK